ncbi:MAG: glycosyltransferase family 39 protein [Gammaproteobacteria bacterium]
MSDSGRRNDWLLLAALSVILLAVKAWLVHAAGVDLHYDEAQYWEWSRRLDWSYYSKGPLIAWLIALSEGLFGHGAWQVRLPAWLAHCGLLFLVFAFARDVWGTRRAAWWAVIIFLFTPEYFTLGLVMTTDIWLFLCWTWGLWAAYRALTNDRPASWYEAGVAVGIGTLTKLSIGLLPAGLGIAVLLNRRWHHHLKSHQLWIGLLIMALLMSPLLWWNAEHGWVMFHHEQGHFGHIHWSLGRGLYFLAGQTMVLSPLVVLVAFSVLRHRPAPAGQRLLWGLSLGWIAFFFLKALTAKVEVNWPAPSYIGLVILFAGHVHLLPRWKRRTLFAGFGFSLAAMTLIYFLYDFGFTNRQDPFKDTKAWRGPVAALSRETPSVDFILTPNYKIAAEVAFYWPHRLPVYVAGSTGRRFNQHDLWPSINREAGHDGLWVSPSPGAPAELARAFATCTPLPPVQAVTPDGNTLRTLYARHCVGYKPIVWPKPTTY